MGHKYQINIIPVSTRETPSRILLAQKSQFKKFEYRKKVKK
jgi:hypothetical protein